jgi:hypothetical protein
VFKIVRDKELVGASDFSKVCVLYVNPRGTTTP